MKRCLPPMIHYFMFGNKSMDGISSLLMRIIKDLLSIAFCGLWLDNKCIFFQSYFKAIKEASPMVFNIYYSFMFNGQAYSGVYPHCWSFLVIVTCNVVYKMIRRRQFIVASDYTRGIKDLVKKYTVFITLLHSFLLAEILHMETLHTQDNLIGFPLVARTGCLVSVTLMIGFIIMTGICQKMQLSQISRRGNKLQKKD